ncbi:MAG: phosphorylase [Bacteroidetes bacterium]|nr:phosphorylase [Bacteroidota bacterium]
MTYSQSELVLNGNGAVYHLGVKPENISNKIILVGDQDRVSLVSRFFDSIEHKSQHREFVCHTGSYKGQRITALSSGIGTDNIDIILNELDALVNIDLQNRTDKQEISTLEIVRIGTCGILQRDIPVHSWIISDYALGLDNVAHFYQTNFTKEEIEICDKLKIFLNLPSAIKPYFVLPSEHLTNKLKSKYTISGITITSSGFYGPQGRQLRLKTRTENLQLALGDFQHNGVTVTNFEMESSALFALGRALGHKCATICLGVANRPMMEFSKGYSVQMSELIKYVLDRI